MTPVQGPDREEKLNHMVLTYEKDLLRLCCAYLRDIDLARDAVQETFLKAYRRMDKFEGKSSEKTWLMRIAINTCKDMLRGGWFRRIDRKVDMADLPETAAPFAEPDDTITRAILSLQDDLRQVVTLRYYQGCSIQEVAEVLHIGRRTVHYHLDKAERALRAALEDWYHAE